MDFSAAPAAIMHVDINSCFATVEQQANPLLRGRPVAVAAYVKDYGCILAASVEAKRLGIKTCMRVREAKMLARDLVVLPPDPDKYRHVNRALRTLLETYTPDVSVESIDEMVIQLQQETRDMQQVAKEIKLRIKQEIGDWITVSIGIAPNRYLAKVASGMQKPDGLVTITKENIQDVFGSLKLEDLCGIKEGNATRLRASGIATPLAMLEASPKALQWALRSIVGYHWWMRVHGYEDGSRYKAFGSTEGEQKSFGQSHALEQPKTPEDTELWHVLAQLVSKMARRMRQDGYVAFGTGVSLVFADRSVWGAQQKSRVGLFADDDFYKRARTLLTQAPLQPVRILGVSCYDLQSGVRVQQSLFGEDDRKRSIIQAMDRIHDRFGEYTLTFGRVLSPRLNEDHKTGKVYRGANRVLDRISFGKIRSLAGPV
jgi:DNA polymerase-4